MESNSSVVSTYRKKLVIIEAMQWDGSSACATKIIDWILASGGTARYHGDGPWNYFINEPDGSTIVIDTFEGTTCAVPREFIIRDVNNEFCSCEPDGFTATYEPMQVTELAYDVRRLRLKPGDILVITCPTKLSYDRIDSIQNGIREVLGADVSVVLLDGGMNLTVVNENELSDVRQEITVK